MLSINILMSTKDKHAKFSVNLNLIMLTGWIVLGGGGREQR